MDKKQHLDVIASEIKDCKNCSLYTTPGLHVPGEGNLEAQVMLLGEAPGATEAELGRPFVGRAGKLLDNMIQSMDLKREDVFIANICKHRPPNNRKPTPEEMSACLPFLLRQIDIIKPKVIIGLGSTALEGLTGNGAGITRRCGHWESMRGSNIPVMCCFHPSALLRNPHWKEPAWYALQEVVKYLKDPL